MARKRSRVKATTNNPSTVLIIFLVFFILLSLGLGVWGYFKVKTVDEGQKIITDLKAKKDADAKAIQFYRLEYLWMKAAAGHELGKNPNGVDEATDLQDLMTRFEEGKLDDAAGSNKASFEELVRKDKDNLGPMRDEKTGQKLERDPKTGEVLIDPKTKKVLKFPNYDVKTKRFSNNTGYFANWEKYTTTIAAQEIKYKDSEAERKRLEDQDQVRKKQHDDLWTKLNTRVTNVIKGASDAAKAYEEAREKAEKAEKAALGKAEENIKKELGNIKTDIDKKTAEIAKLKEDFARILKEKEDRIARLLVGRTDTEAAKTGEKTAQVDLTKFDAPKGKIMRVDWTGKMPYINLGSGDGVKPQLTFSVYAVSADGKVATEPKGSLEVVKVIGPHLSQARIINLRDASAEPIVEGDLVFNPLWDPQHKTHVAIAGLVDFSGQGSGTLRDQVRNLREFIDNLERQNIEVDAWLDLQTNTVQGKITLQTDYFIVGVNPSYDNSQTLNLKEEKVNVKLKTSEMMETMRKEAVNKGVTIIPLGKFAVLTGYRVPRTLRDMSDSDVRPETSAPKEKGDEDEKPKKDEKKGEKKNGKNLGEDDEKMEEKKGEKKKKKDDENEKE